MQQGLAGQLLQAGLEYAMVRLAALCEAHLARCIRINTAVDILLLADSCRAQVSKLANAAWQRLCWHSS